MFPCLSVLRLLFELPYPGTISGDIELPDYLTGYSFVEW